MKLLTKKTVVVLVVSVLFVIVAASFLRGSGNKSVVYRAAPVKKGDLLAAISATGTVEPEEVVDVGAQVAGQINSFGKDKNGKTIDYGSVVEEGTILAQIDDSLYAADVALANAQLQQARAGVLRAEADLGQLKSRLNQAKRDWERAQRLGPSEALAQSSYDAYKSGYEIAQANVAVGEAAIIQAKDAVAQSQATLQRAQRNLGYCTIKSPVKGVIIDRRVNIGQTVVSSLNAPSLFLIAKDLKRMQVWVSVNEADVGSIHPGQPVSFTVDAYPGQIFRGEVGKIRLNATMTQNVVTYTVEVITDNSSGKLLPYLTANAQFELSQRRNVLIVPNAALRWYPQLDQVAPKFRAMADGSGPRDGLDTGEQPTAKPAANTDTRSSQGLLWTQDGSYLRPVKVHVGLTDGTMTEVQGDDVKEGMEVIVGEQRQETTDTGTTNPFAPQPMRRSRP